MILSNEQVTIFSGQDISVIRKILTHLANFDKTSLQLMGNVEVPNNPCFWLGLQNFPATFILPPTDFISTWQLQFVYDKSVLLMSGPLWTKEEGESDLWLFTEKYSLGNRPTIKIIDYRVP